jgi:hypothetical protein
LDYAIGIIPVYPAGPPAVTNPSGGTGVDPAGNVLGASTGPDASLLGSSISLAVRPNPVPGVVGAVAVLLIALAALAGQRRLLPARYGLVVMGRRIERPDYRGFWSLALLMMVAWPAAVVGLASGYVTVPIAAGVLGALVVLGLTIWRPVIGCLILVLAVPLTAGMGRNTVVPLVRPSEALTALVAVGMLAHFLPRRRRLGFTTLDLAVAAFAIGGAVIPWAVLYLSHQAAGIDTWQTVFAPLQYLLIYLMFSRLQPTEKGLRLALQLEMLASVIVGVIGLAQLADLPGVRDLIANTYPIGGQINICQYGVCRPTSLLDHWSSYGAFAVLNYAIALALVSTRRVGFSNRWLTLVMAVNAVAVLASQTQAAVVGLVLVTVIVLVHRRHVPRQLAMTAAGLALGLAIFWPQIQARLSQQLTSGGSSSSTPESLQTRFTYWGELYVPILREHLWTGTGTVISTDVPDRLTLYVDNEYVRMGLRAGIGGELLLVLMLAAVAAVGWRSRGSPRPIVQALGAMSMSYAIAIAVMGTTAEFLTFVGVTQLFWMIVGLLAGSLLPATIAWRESSVLSLGGRARVGARENITAPAGGPAKRLGTPV